MKTRDRDIISLVNTHSNTLSVCVCDSLFKLGEHVGHHHAALDGFLCGVVVFKQSEHVPAVLHGQTADQLLHHLTHKRTNTECCITYPKVHSVTLAATAHRVPAALAVTHLSGCCV